MDKKCGECGKEIPEYEGFPPRAGKQGSQCLECYADSPEGKRMPSAAELAHMWGGRRGRRR